MLKIKYKGPTLDPSGYGRAARDYIGALNTTDAQIKVEPWGFEQKAPDFYGDAGRLVEELKHNDIDYDFVIHHYVPNRPAPEQGKINIGLVAWETTKLPDAWVDNMNSNYDMLIVPSEFNRRCFKASGINIPIEVVPHAINVQELNDPEISNLKLKGFENYHSFLSVFQWTARKNPHGLLKSYFSAFEGHSDVVLILKTYRSSTSIKEQRAVQEEIREIKRNTKLKSGKYPPIYFIGELINRETMISLYKNCDCFVLPTRGEAVGLPYIESAACGMDEIYTGFGGQTELFNSTSGMIDYQLTPVSDMPWIPNYYADQFWAEPNLEHLIDLMRKSYESGIYTEPKLNEFSYQNIGNQFTEAIKRNFSC